MSKKKNKKVVDDGSEKKKNNDAGAANEHKKEEPSGKANQKSDAGETKENNGGGGNAVLLKTDLHCDCEGCAGKVAKFVRAFSGVEAVKVERSSGKIIVNGKVDPVALRDKLEEKTRSKVELLSPAPKKDKENAKAKDGGGDGKGDKKKDSAGKDNAKAGKDEKTPKVPPVTTAVLKVPLHCEGCIKKIYKIVSKSKGFEEIKIDHQKDLVAVKGAIDTKDLAEKLKKNLKRDVEIVPPKKDEKKEKGNAEGGGGGGAGKEKGNASNGNDGGDGMERMEWINRMQALQLGQPFGYGPAFPPPPPPGYGYPNPSPFVYGAPAYVDPYQFHYPAPQMFSDENPNACAVM